MRFTEHELTVAVTGAAKAVTAGKRLRKRGVEADAQWNAMDRYERFKLLDAIGSQILPVLVALPDIEVAPGTRPSYPTDEVREVVSRLVGDEIGRLRRRVVIDSRTALVQTALAHVPPRSDTDALGQTDEGS